MNAAARAVRLLLMLVALAAWSTAAAAAFTLPVDSREIALGAAIKVIPEPGQKLDPQAVLDGAHDAQGLHLTRSPPNLGYPRQPVWAVLELNNPTDRSLSRLLVLWRGLAHTQHAWFRAIDADGRIVAAGDSDGMDVRSRHSVVRLHLPAHATTRVAVRIDSSTALLLDYRLLDAASLARIDRIDFWFLGLVIGAQVAFAMFMATIFLATRERIYFTFVGIACCATVYHLHVEGLAYRWWPSDLRWWGNLTGLYVAAGNWMLLPLFVRDFVNVTEHQPRLYRGLIRPLVGLLATAFILFPIAPWLGNSIAALGAVLMSVALAIVVIRAARIEPPVWSFFFGILLNFGLTVVFLLKRSGVLLDSQWVSLAQIGGSVVVVVSFAVAVMHRVRAVVEAHQQAQANYASRLEAQVEKRTSELAAANTQLQAAHSDLAALSTIGREITAQLDLDRVLQGLFTQIERLMPAEVFGIGLHRPERHEIEFPFAVEAGRRYQPYARSTHDKNQLAVWCIEQRQAILIGDYAAEHSRYIRASDQASNKLEDGSMSREPVSALYVPVLLHGAAIGVISVQCFTPNAYVARHLEMLRTLSVYAAVAIDNARAHAELMALHRNLLDAQQQLVLSEKMAGLGTLTAGIAHEINNPSNFISGALQNLEAEHQQLLQFLRELAGDEADAAVLAAFDRRFDELAQMTSTAREGCQRIQAIVRDLRTFTRLDEAEYKAVPTSELVHATINLIRTRFPRIAFDVDLAVDPVLDCYPAKLSQLLLSLITNGCEAIERCTDARAGRVDIRSDARERDAARVACIRISDNGCGMDAATQAKMFEPFFTTKSVGSGTGLGLAMAFGIAREHHGTLEVSSRLGAGTCIELILPRSTLHPSTPMSPPVDDFGHSVPSTV